MRRLIKQSTILRRLYFRARKLRAASESDESAIIAQLTADATPTFVEFGFHPVEFNCVALAGDPTWQGLLIDGSKQIVDDARALWPERIRMVNAFLSLDNLDLVRSQFEKIGLLSIDVDGNDYWFLKALIDLSPDVISVEYNSSFELRPVTVAYDPSFDRLQKHPKGWYHGASLTALTKLCAAHGYGLAAGSDGSCNAFFTRNGNLKPEDVFKPKRLREKLSGIPHAAQWDFVKDMPFQWV
jgi:hypothetical protein